MTIVHSYLISLSIFSFPPSSTSLLSLANSPSQVRVPTLKVGQKRSPIPLGAKRPWYLRRKKLEFGKV